MSVYIIYSRMTGFVDTLVVYTRQIEFSYACDELFPTTCAMLEALFSFTLILTKTNIFINPFIKFY